MSQQKAPSIVVIQQLAARLEATYTPPRDADSDSIISGEEFKAVVELALADGYWPLSKTFHYWKNRGAIQVGDHYAAMVAMYRKAVGNFRFLVFRLGKQELEENLLEKDDFAVACYVVPQGREDMYGSYFRTILDATGDLDKAKREAAEMINRPHIGVVKRSEITYKNGNINPWATPKGWIPGWTRAEVRAIRGALMATFGMPDFKMRHSMTFGNLDSDMVNMALEQAPQHVLSAGEDAVGNFAKAVAAANGQAAGNGMKKEERVSLMRGDDDDVIDLPRESAKEIPDLLSPEQVMDDLNKAGYSDEEIVKISDHLFGMPVLDLNPLQLHNMKQYVLIAKFVKADLEEAKKSIAAIEKAESLTDARDSLTAWVKSESEAGSRIEIASE